MRRILRFVAGILLPSVLILAGILFLTGCFYVPTFNITSKGTNVAAKVGDANSRRPIRVGFATCEQIIRMFGEPPYRDASGNRIRYSWSVKNGIWINPFCFASEDQIEDRGIELDFDERGVLRRFFLVPATKHYGGVTLALMQYGPPNGTERPAFDQDLHPNNQDLQRSQH